MQDKLKRHNEFFNVICKCGSLSKAEYYEKYTYFHVFFIPVFKWNREHLIRLRCCSSLYKASDDYADELRRSQNLDINRLEEIEISFNQTLKGICAFCSERIHPSFSYCPYCGNRTN